MSKEDFMKYAMQRLEDKKRSQRDKERKARQGATATDLPTTLWSVFAGLRGTPERSRA